ncbi:hypothetical protein [Micavibrio aeruginosavorus]|uniref:hypothetical protein n=1 Tax=Micavibrio aeruginosavorus TaxID=349221 RepID=UPI003F4ABF98
MTQKSVTFDYYDKRQLSDVTVLTRLPDIFLLATSRDDGAVFTARKDQFSFEISRDSFLRLADQKVFPPVLLQAFAKIDERMTAYDARCCERSEPCRPSLARLEDDVEGFDGLKISMRRLRQG